MMDAIVFEGFKKPLTKILLFILMQKDLKKTIDHISHATVTIFISAMSKNRYKIRVTRQEHFSTRIQESFSCLGSTGEIHFVGRQFGRSRFIIGLLGCHFI
jgi:hypothetical protein